MFGYIFVLIGTQRINTEILRHQKRMQLVKEIDKLHETIWELEIALLSKEKELKEV